MNIKEIANLAGVSISTVSKIVNNKADNINKDTIERVLRIVKEYNYAPYSLKPGNTGSKTFIIGVLLKKSQDTNLLVNGILTIAKLLNYSIMIFDSANNLNDELKNITSLCKHRVDGVIWEPVSSESLKHHHYFKDNNIHTVFINNTELSDPFIKSVSYTIDFFQIGYDATQVLINNKHTNIACLCKENSFRSAMVLEGFKKCLFENQIPFNNKMIVSNSDTSLNDFYINKPTAIVCSHFYNSLNILEKIEKLHLNIPYDISIVTLRDDVRDNFLFPKISTFKIPFYEFGQYVCKKVISLCEDTSIAIEENFNSLSILENSYTIDVPFSLKAKKIVVVGSINIDITLNVNELPSIGKTLTTNRAITSSGGKGINQAVGAAKLKKTVSLIGKIGNDYESSIIMSTLDKNGIDSTSIIFDNQLDTGAAYIHVRNDGESSITIVNGANNALSAKDIKDKLYVFENAGYCLLQTEVPERTILEAAKTAKFFGAKTILKPSTMLRLNEELFKYIDIVIPNEIEASSLCPDSTLDQQADFFLSKGVQTVIITLGKKGCYMKDKTTSKHYPPADVVVLDSTGAADAFISAFACYSLDGYSIDESIKIATISAGFCISRFGVSDSMIDKDSLDQYILNNQII